MKRTTKRLNLRNGFTAMSVGQRLEWLLVVRRLTQVELARMANLSQPTIANLVGSASRRPSANTLLSLARALGTSPYFLLRGEGEPLSDENADTSDERQLLDNFRQLEPMRQAHVLTFSRVMLDWMRG